MSIYLLHLDPKYRHAAHYVGFTPEEDVTRRVSEHLAGGAKASPLVKPIFYS
jgi:predicted GIY-YIG superfamily endonuclease